MSFKLFFETRVANVMSVALEKIIITEVSIYRHGYPEFAVKLPYLQ